MEAHKKSIEGVKIILDNKLNVLLEGSNPCLGAITEIDSHMSKVFGILVVFYF